MNLDRSFFRFVTIHACDRQTERRTDGQTEISSQYRGRITCSAVKKAKIEQSIRHKSITFHLCGGTPTELIRTKNLHWGNLPDWIMCAKYKKIRNRAYKKSGTEKSNLRSNFTPEVVLSSFLRMRTKSGQNGSKPGQNSGYVRNRAWGT